MKSESIMWRKVRPVLVAAKLDPIRVENPIHPGTPDVNLADGKWIELKCLPAWPSRATTLVRIPHFTPQQRVFLIRRWKCIPGSTFLLLEVRADHQWLLFDGDVASEIVGRATTADHRKSARAVMSVQDLAQLPQALTEAAAPPSKDEGPRCTGSLVHDEYTPCPVHDAAWRAPR